MKLGSSSGVSRRAFLWALAAACLAAEGRGGGGRAMALDDAAIGRMAVWAG